MIYASKVDNSLILAAADSFAELEAAYGKVVLDKKQRATYQNEYQPSLSDMLLDDRFNNFKKPPYVFEFDSEDDLNAFVQTHNIYVIHQRALTDKHLDMIADMQADPYMGDGADHRLIEEILGLEDDDPWDHRTEEQKQQDEEHKKEAESAKKAGKLSGDSFGPSTKRKRKKKGETDNGSDVNVTDIRTSRNEDGSIEIDDVLAVKGLYDDNGKGAWLPTDAEVAAKKAAENNANEDAETPVVINAEPGEQFYRFNLSNQNTDNLEHDLDLLGELSEYAPNEERDQIILDQDAGSFVLRGERIAQKLSLYYDFHQINHSVQLVDANFKASRKKFKLDEAVAQHINPNGWVAIFYRVDIAGGRLAHVVHSIEKEGVVQNSNLMENLVAARGQMMDHCWLACATKLGAETIQKIILEDLSFTNPEIEVYGVNDKGERLVPKGVVIVTDEVKEEPPRPWNAKAAEWDAMTDEQRKEVKITGKEFIFCGSYRGAGDGCILYITPRVYFQEHGEMWEGDLTKIVRFPDDLKQVRPGIFQTKSRPWIPLCQDLATRGMVESLGLQLHINSLD